MSWSRDVEDASGVPGWIRAQEESRSRHEARFPRQRKYSEDPLVGREGAVGRLKIRVGVGGSEYGFEVAGLVLGAGDASQRMDKEGGGRGCC